MDQVQEQPLIEAIPDSPAVWEKHFSMDSWTLKHEHFELMGYRGRKHDGTVMDIYGWVDKELVGPDAGKYAAGYPKPYDPETDSDAVRIGVFDNPEDAKAAVLAANMPLYGFYM